MATGQGVETLVEEFVADTKGITSPAIFRQWGMIYAVSAAMDRRWWVTVQGRPIFPNLFTLLIGGSGVGKSTTILRVREILGRVPGVTLAPTDTTKAGLVDYLVDSAQSHILPGGDPYYYNSLHIVISELGNLMQQYDTGLMALLTDLYDCGAFIERKRSAGSSIEIPRTLLGLIAADTPSHLTSILPEGAWEQGFLSRTILVYSSQRVTKPLFGLTEAAEDRLTDKYAAALERIAKHIGPVTFTAESQELLNEWHLAGGPPAPTHPRLETYATRRSLHLVKLCMIAAAADNCSTVVTAEHVTTAQGWLFSAEATHAEFFAAGTSEQQRTLEDILHKLRQIETEVHKGPIPASDVYRVFIAFGIAPQQLQFTLTALMNMRRLRRVQTKTGELGYVTEG